MLAFQGFEGSGYDLVEEIQPFLDKYGELWQAGDATKSPADVEWLELLEAQSRNPLPILEAPQGSPETCVLDIAPDVVISEELRPEPGGVTLFTNDVAIPAAGLFRDLTKQRLVSGDSRAARPTNRRGRRWRIRSTVETSNNTSLSGADSWASTHP